jgi:hypothetical protein
LAADGLSGSEGAATAEDGGGSAELAALAEDDKGGAAAAAGRPAPSVTVSVMPVAVRARTAAKRATPDRKLISSIRTFSARLSLAAQPVPSLTTKHDTGVQSSHAGGWTAVAPVIRRRRETGGRPAPPAGWRA